MSPSFPPGAGTVPVGGVAMASASETPFALLVSLQFVVTWLQVRWPAFGTVVTNPPTLLYFRGEFLQDAMRRERVAEPEVQTAVRKNGYGSVGEVEAVVLESSGEFSVLESLDEPESFADQLEQGGESSA